MKNQLKQQQLVQLAEQALHLAKQEGSTDAEVSLSKDIGFSVTTRLGNTETIEYNKDNSIDVTVYRGQRKGVASTTDTSFESIERTVKAACDIARFTEEDPFSGLADEEMLAKDYPELDLYHPSNLSPEAATELALSCENAALSMDARITNSEGANLTTQQSCEVYVNSRGFLGTYLSSYHSLSCTLIAKQKSEMQRDSYYTSACDLDDLLCGKEVAKRAVANTVQRLGSRAAITGRMPIILQAEVARTLLRIFAGAISGGNLYRDSSFLVNCLGKKIFPSHIRIHEQPHLKKALGSAAFDDEGLPTAAKDFIQEGVLSSYLLSVYSARKLGMKATGNAGGVHNLSISHSDLDLPALLKQMQKGILVTELMGHGVNLVTGDYSQGACGFWVEQGKIQYPIDGFTIAGNLKDMFRNLVSVANDVDMRGNIRSGSILLAEMSVAAE